MRTLLSYLLLALAFTRTALAEPQVNPLSGQGVARGASYTAEELRELDELEQRVHEFESKAAEYRELTRHLIEQKYNAHRQALFQSYEELIVQLEKDQRAKRDEAVARFEAFIKEYPSEPRYTPDAMFRLAELYFEQSYDGYFRQRQAYDRALEAWASGGGRSEPVEPELHYEPTIAMMQRLLTQFPNYRLVDGAYYLLGYCLTEQGEEDRATVVYEELTSRFPKSKFAPEVWTRIGEYYFNSNELERALRAYSSVLGEVESPYYDKALYKLAWTHYRLADPDRTPQEYQAAVDTFVRLVDFNESTRREGNERGGDLRNESIQYIAISYADEQWGGLEKAVLYFQGIGGRVYERHVYRALGDVYFDQTRFAEAIRAYDLVLQRFPNDPTAPDVQDKIIAAYERDRNFDGAAAARERLTALFGESGAWHAANRNDAEALKNAKRLTESSLYTAALFHHRQAQVAREASKIDMATAAYRRAAAAYGEYLRRFPNDKEAYELTFYHAETLYYAQQFALAAEQYEKVRDSNLDNRFLELAAYNAILAYERDVQVAEQKGAGKVKVQKSTDRDAAMAIAPRPIPSAKLKVITASDRFASAVPNSPEVPKVLYKAGEIYYTYDHFDEARRRFGSLLDAYPQHQVAEYAANLIIESYLTEKNYAAVEEFSRGLLARAATPGVGRGFKGDLVKYKAGAMFKIAEDLQASGQPERAAAEYLRILGEHPDNQFADSALNNAAVAYEQARRYESASKLYERLVREYPKSALADAALFRVGLNAERFFDFDKATQSYLKLVDEYPKSEKRADAIYNAALSLENTQNYEAAARQYQRYCELFPTRDDAPAVCFRAGSVYEKMGEPQKVITTYSVFGKRYKGSVKDADRVAEADLKIAKAYERLKKPRDAEKYYEATVADFRKNPNDKSAPYAAEAQFQLVEREFEQFRSIAVMGNTAQQKSAIVRKASTLKQVEAHYKQVLGFKQVDWTMASLFRIGQLYQSFAEAIIKAPCPVEVKRSAKKVGATEEEVCEEYRVLLEEQAGTVEDKAVAAYETAITKARELQVANNWTKQTLVALNKLRRAQWPLQKDAKSFVDERLLSAPPVALADGRTARPSDAEATQ